MTMSFGRRLLLRRALSTSKSTDVCIVAAVRTPIGGFNGSLAALSAPALGAAAIQGALSKAKVDPSIVEQVRASDLPPCLRFATQ